MTVTGSSRRNFIKGLGKAALGGVVAASTGGIAIANAQDKSAPKPLAGRTAIITGAARGIGLATALKLAAQGANIGLIDIANSAAYPKLNYRLSSAEDLEKAKAAVLALGVKAISVAADVSNEAQMVSAIQKIAAELGGVDIIVANAAIANNTMMEKNQDTALFRDVISVNLIGVANTIRPAIEFLKNKEHRGRVIAISSMAGRMGIPSLSAYGASKWGVVGLVKTLSLELGHMGITVNAVAPSGVKTAMMVSENSGDYVDTMLKTFHALPDGLLEPEAIAESIYYLASDEAKHISGIVLDVSAGLSGRNLG